VNPVQFFKKSFTTDYSNDRLRDHLKILDVGANLGQNLLLFCSQTKEVAAFEPNPGCLEEIKKSLGYNRYTPRLVHAAVGSVQSELILRWPTCCSWYGTVSDTDHLNQMGYEKFEECRVPVVALDQEVSISGEKILLKIDVEGHEIDVLQGGRDLLCQNDCLVVFEHDFSRSDGRNKIWNNLTELGYGVYGIQADAASPLKGPYTLKDYLSDRKHNHAAVRQSSIFRFLIVQ
jgi:FkbM family methyltransferase